MIKAEFTLNGKAVSGEIDGVALLSAVAQRKAFSSQLKVNTNNEQLVLPLSCDVLCLDASSGSIFCELETMYDFDKNTTLKSIELGDIVHTSGFSEQVSGETDISLMLQIFIKEKSIFAYGDNALAAALLGLKPLGQLYCRLGNDEQRTLVELSAQDGKLILWAQNLQGEDELVIENESSPILRIRARDFVRQQREIAGICNERGSFVVHHEICGVISLSVGGSPCDDEEVYGFVSEIQRVCALKEGGDAFVLGEPTHRFVALKMGNTVTRYSLQENVPTPAGTMECKDAFALCSDGAIIVLNDDGAVIYTSDNREIKCDVPYADAVVIVDEPQKYHFALKRGGCLLRYVVDKENGVCELVSAVVGSDINLFRASKEAIGYRDGDLVAIVTSDSYKEFDYPFSGDPDDFGFISDCRYFCSKGKSGNYRFGTSFDLDCDFIGCDGLACVDNNLVALNDSVVTLASGISSAAVIGDYVICAEADAAALYYAYFNGAYVLSEKAATHAYVFSFYERVNPFETASDAKLQLNFEEDPL